MAATEPIRDKRELKRFVRYYLKNGQLRNYTLIVLGIHTALRISDLLRLKWRDVYCFESKRFKTHINLTEKKTGKTTSIALNKAAIHALAQYFPSKRGAYIFASSRKNAAPICRVQAYRIIRAAGAAARITTRISCHSLRKTLGYHAWRSGTAVAVIMDIYNHTSYEVTRRYLGISQDDKDKVYLGLSLL